VESLLLCVVTSRAVASRKEQKERARQERLAREAAQKGAARRKRRLTLLGGAASVAVVAAVVAIAVASGGGSGISQKLSKLGSTPELKIGSLASLGALKPSVASGSLGSESIPVPTAPPLASTSSMATGGSVDGMQCGSEQTLFHIHAHLTVFVDGAPRQIPYGIGITSPQVQNTPQGPYVAGGSCLYWLHTHAPDGIIHIESPVQRTFTLANFFDLWGEPLGPHQVGPAVGPVTAIYNGNLYHGNPRDIPLNAHAQIELDVGKPIIAPVTITFTGSL
jgi:hypothetical protein